MRVCLACILVLTSTAAPASESRVDMPCARPTGWERFACDSFDVWNRITLQEPGSVARAVPVAWGTALLYTAREPIRDAIQERVWRNGPVVSESGRVLGGAAIAPAVAGAFYLAGKLSGEPYHVETAQIVLTSTLEAAALAVAGSFVLAAERPRDGNDVEFLSTGGHGVSLDVALAASLVAPVDRRYLRSRPDDPRGRRFLKGAARVILYSGVALVALQRLESDAHWAPDVFLGAVAGFTVGYTVCRSHERAGGRSGR